LSLNQGSSTILHCLPPTGTFNACLAQNLTAVHKGHEIRTSSKFIFHATSEATMANILPIGTEQVHVMKISIRIIYIQNR